PGILSGEATTRHRSYDKKYTAGLLCGPAGDGDRPKARPFHRYGYPPRWTGDRRKWTRRNKRVLHIRRPVPGEGNAGSYPENSWPWNFYRFRPFGVSKFCTLRLESN